MFKIDKLSKTYKDGTLALDGVSFVANPGEFIVILGRSGSGKSTLLRCVNRLVEPTEGRVFLGDHEITGANPSALMALRRKIGMVFQHYNLINRLTAWTNALTGCLGFLPLWMSLVGYFPRELTNHALSHLERVGVCDKVNSRVDNLSGGQQQRVGIARALVQNPKLILVDEPVSSLDPTSAKSIMDLLREINEKNGVTILCSLHLPDLAKEYGHRVIVLKNGEVAFDGTPEKINKNMLELFYESS